MGTGQLPGSAPVPTSADTGRVLRVQAVSRGPQGDGPSVSLPSGHRCFGLFFTSFPRVSSPSWALEVCPFRGLMPRSVFLSFCPGLKLSSCLGEHSSGPTAWPLSFPEHRLPGPPRPERGVEGSGVPRARFPPLEMSSRTGEPRLWAVGWHARPQEPIIPWKSE